MAVSDSGGIIVCCVQWRHYSQLCTVQQVKTTLQCYHSIDNRWIFRYIEKWIIHYLNGHERPAVVTTAMLQYCRLLESMHKTGNGIISAKSWSLIIKLLLQNIFHLDPKVQNSFKKQEMKLYKQEMKFFSCCFSWTPM